MRTGLCRSYPFTWYPTAIVGRFDFDREHGMAMRWLWWCFYVTVNEQS